MTAGPDIVAPPDGGLWRVARGDDPLALPRSIRGATTSGANRFDPLTIDAGVLYFGTDLETCFGETLARLRPSLTVLSVVEDEWRELGFMDIGQLLPTGVSAGAQSTSESQTAHGLWMWNRR